MTDTTTLRHGGGDGDGSDGDGGRAQTPSARSPNIPVAGGRAPPPVTTMARTWSPGGLPAILWSHTEERVPGGGVATVARASSGWLGRRSGREEEEEEEEEEEARGPGGSCLDEPLLGVPPPTKGGAAGVAAGRPARRPPRYDPPTLPIIPPPPRAADGDGGGDSDAAAARRAAWATRVSLAANILLLAAKAAVYALSGSKAVLASATDSLVDLASQIILSAATAAAARRDPRFPAGKARMTTVGVACAAGLMLVATAAVVQGAAGDLFEGLVEHSPPTLVVGPALFAVLLGGTLLKAALFALCARAAQSAPPGAADTLAALAEDHRTDALTNVVAAGASLAVVAGGPPAWPVDPVAALALSAYILFVWGRIFARTINKLVGRGAPPEVMAALEAVCAEHAEHVDVLKAWHVGDALLCECEIVMSPDAPLRHTHDVALSLQHALEAVRVGDVAVERAYVHVDYARRAEPEHALDRAAAAAERGEGRGAG